MDDKILAGFAGAIGGMTKYVTGVVLLQFDFSLLARVVEAGAAALICGFLGVAGKDCYGWLKKKFIIKKP